MFLNAVRLKKFVIKLFIDIFEFSSIPDWYKTQEICDRIIFEDPFMIVYCPDRYKSQGVYDEAVDDCQVALKFLPD